MFGTIIACPAFSVLQGLVDLLEAAVDVVLDVEIHGHESLGGVQVEPLEGGVRGAGAVDDPVVGVLVAVVVEDVLEEQADGCLFTHLTLPTILLV